MPHLNQRKTDTYPFTTMINEYGDCVNWSNRLIYEYVDREAYVRGDRLKNAREMRGLSQEELGQRCGLSKQQIYRYEVGLNIPGADALSDLSRTLEVSSDYLLGLVSEPDEHLEKEDLSPMERRLIDAYRSGELRTALQILSIPPPQEKN